MFYFFIGVISDNRQFRFYW